MYYLQYPFIILSWCFHSFVALACRMEDFNVKRNFDEERVRDLYRKRTPEYFHCLHSFSKYIKRNLTQRIQQRNKHLKSFDFFSSEKTL